MIEQAYKDSIITTGRDYTLANGHCEEERRGNHH
ncbi:MAG: hypothetical protein ACI9N9_000271 [Enterobacterales bacterium]|jgi:hypothetical protein